MIESMSTTPGTGDALPVSAAEALGASVATTTNPTETGADVNAGLVSALESVMSQSPASRVDTGFASLAGIDPGEIGPSIAPGEPTSAAPEPVADSFSTEAPVTPIQEPTYFPYVMEAKKALAEAKARNASQSDIEGLELKLQQATNKEGLLMSGITLIQIDAEIAEAKKRGASQEEIAELNTRKNEATRTRETLYEETFKQIRAHVNKNKDRDPRSFEQTVDDLMLKEAQEIKDAMQLGLTRATELGNEEEIETARLRLQAAEMHVGIIKKKKGRGIRAMLKGLAMSLGVTALGETAKVSKGELTPPRNR